MTLKRNEVCRSGAIQNKTVRRTQKSFSLLAGGYGFCSECRGVMEATILQKRSLDHLNVYLLLFYKDITLFIALAGVHQM